MSTDNFDTEIQDAQGANPEQLNHPETTDQIIQEAAPDIDYKVKFAESSKEALRLLEETREKDRIIAELQASQDQGLSHDQTMENLYPGFEDLDEQSQINLQAYTDAITRKAKSEILQDPAIAYSRKQYNENVWNGAFEKVLIKYPELANSKDEFKSKYFKPNNVPANIDTILEDVAKIHLFDSARTQGAEEEKARKEHVEIERTTGGDRNVRTTRSLEEWHRMATDNPAKFASMRKEYNEDLNSGKI